MKSVFKALALATLLSPALATPAQASSYPTEISVGPVLGVAGPGLAFRMFPVSWLGFQVGANTFGSPLAVGGALLVSPYHDAQGHRIYLSAGGARMVPLRPGDVSEVYPAVGLGVSRLMGGRWTFLVDLSVIPWTVRYADLTRAEPLIVPQMGFLWTF